MNVKIKGTKIVGTDIPTLDVIAASVAAHEFNGAYYNIQTNDIQPNKAVMVQYLTGEYTITDKHREQANQIIAYYNGLIFKKLANDVLNDWEEKALSIVNNETMNCYWPGQEVYNFDGKKVEGTIQQYNQQFAIAACIPASYKRAMFRKDADNRLKEVADNGYVAKVGERITTRIEVIKCIFSQNYFKYFATGVTIGNQAVFFATDANLQVGSRINIKGTVKAHREESLTQLNRVKILEVL